MLDPDKGQWEYRYNALGELVVQSKLNAVGQEAVVTTIVRDVQGRTVKRTVTQGTSSNVTLHQYGTGNTAHRLLTTCFGNSAGQCDNSRPYTTFGYDSLGRQHEVTRTITTDGVADSVTSRTTWDAFGRVFQQFDDDDNSRGVRSHFNEQGYPYKQEEARYSGSTNEKLVYSEVKAMNAFGQVTQVKRNNGFLDTTRGFDSHTGLMSSSHTQYGNAVLQHNDYQYDQLGNMKRRRRHGLSSAQSFISYKNDDDVQSTIGVAWQVFDYDALNRLTHITRSETGQSSATVKERWLSYGAGGNILWKKDMGHYCYNASRPHALSRVQSSACSGSETATFTYDDWGNMTGGRGRDVVYSAFDKATRMTRNSKTTTFAYDASHHRYERITDINSTTQQRTLYFGNIERIYEGTQGSWTLKETRRNLGGVIQTLTPTGNGTDKETTQFLHKDNLGSINTITDENNRILQKFYFDPCSAPFSHHT